MYIANSICVITSYLLDICKPNMYTCTCSFVQLWLSEYFDRLMQGTESKCVRFEFTSIFCVVAKNDEMKQTKKFHRNFIVALGSLWQLRMIGKL